MPRFGSTARASAAARRSAAKAATATRESGEFVIHGGLQPGYFVPGTNVLEIDVNNSLPSGPPHVLWLRPEVSGIRIFRHGRFHPWERREQAMPRKSNVEQSVSVV